MLNPIYPAKRMQVKLQLYLLCVCRWKIPDTEEYTSRDPRPDLFNNNYFLDNVLLALEQTSFCDFEVCISWQHNVSFSRW